MLAVMKSGNPYVPLDPAYPPERLAFMLRDCRAVLVLADDGTARMAVLQRWGGQVVAVHRRLLDRAQSSPAVVAAAPRAMQRKVESHQLAYILYTSGSTGKPKGVMGSHGAMLNRFRWMWREHPFRGGELVCSKTSLNFVDSIFEIFGALSAGVPVLMVPPAVRRNALSLARLLRDKAVTRLVLVPSLLRVLLELLPEGLGQALPALKVWSVSGEALPMELVRSFFEAYPPPLEAVLLNLYGSTEVAADVTAAELRRPLTGGSSAPAPAGPRRAAAHGATQLAPIGVAIDQTQVLVLRLAGGGLPSGPQEPDGREVLEVASAGEPGELFVSGANLARGYWRREAQNRKHFVWLRPMVSAPATAPLSSETPRRFTVLARQPQASRWASRASHPQSMNDHRYPAIRPDPHAPQAGSDAVRCFRPGDFGTRDSSGQIYFSGAGPTTFHCTGGGADTRSTQRGSTACASDGGLVSRQPYRACAAGALSCA